MARLPSAKQEATPNLHIVLSPRAAYCINYSLAGQTKFTFLFFMSPFPSGNL